MNYSEEAKKPILDQHIPANLQVATLAMGCFWSPEALFGAMPGVVRTSVGYAGGTTENPTYRTLADHIETVQLEYDADVLRFEQLLEVFFRHHSPTKGPRKRQYTSALFYHSKEQHGHIQEALQKAEERLGEKVRTEVIPYQTFYLAEERHQKWKLRRVPELMADFTAHYPTFQEFNNSTAVARVNGYVCGYGSAEQLIEELATLGLSYPAQQLLLNHFQIHEQKASKL